MPCRSARTPDRRPRCSPSSAARADRPFAPLQRTAVSYRRRLEVLGARRLQSHDDGRYWQMADPGGLVFCVIAPQTPDFTEEATTWP
ncbi:MAG: VOC family protein [Mycobacteriales bacterium]